MHPRFGTEPGLSINYSPSSAGVCRMAEDDERKPLLSRDALSTQTMCTAANEQHIPATLVGGTSVIGSSFCALWSKIVICNNQTAVLESSVAMLRLHCCSPPCSRVLRTGDVEQVRVVM